MNYHHRHRRQRRLASRPRDRFDARVELDENDNAVKSTDMDAIYNTLRSPGSFGSIRNLQRYSGLSQRVAKEYVSKQDA